jgi:hypothetical protein
LFFYLNPDIKYFTSRYAQQVAKFFEFVKRKKGTSDAQPKGKTEQQIVLPRSTGYWLPNGFSNSRVEFTREMSSLGIRV